VLVLALRKLGLFCIIQAMVSWRIGQDRRVGQKTEDGRQNPGDRRQNPEDGFPMNRDVRFTATWLRHRSPPILLDVYYIGWEVVCQVNSNHGFRGFSRICISHREHRGHREKIEKTQKNLPQRSRRAPRNLGVLKLLVVYRAKGRYTG